MRLRTWHLGIALVASLALHGLVGHWFQPLRQQPKERGVSPAQFTVLESTGARLREADEPLKAETAIPVRSPVAEARRPLAEALVVPPVATQTATAGPVAVIETSVAQMSDQLLAATVVQPSTLPSATVKPVPVASTSVAQLPDKARTTNAVQPEKTPVTVAAAIPPTSAAPVASVGAAAVAIPAGSTEAVSGPVAKIDAIRPTLTAVPPDTHAAAIRQTQAASPRRMNRTAEGGKPQRARVAPASEPEPLSAERVEDAKRAQTTVEQAIQTSGAHQAAVAPLARSIPQPAERIEDMAQALPVAAQAAERLERARESQRATAVPSAPLDERSAEPVKDSTRAQSVMAQVAEATVAEQAEQANDATTAQAMNAFEARRKVEANQPGLVAAKSGVQQVPHAAEQVTQVLAAEAASTREPELQRAKTVAISTPPPRRLREALASKPDMPAESEIERAKVKTQNEHAKPVEPTSIAKAERRISTAGNALVSEYRSAVRRKLRQSAEYSNTARWSGMYGTTVVRFVVQAGGEVSATQVVRSSGNVILDEAALDAIRRAAPFPPIPAAAKRQSWTFTVPLQFTP